MSKGIRVKPMPDDAEQVRIRLPNGFLFRCRNEWLLQLSDALTDFVEYGDTKQ